MVNTELLEDLCYDAGETRKGKAMEYVAKKRVDITKVAYEDNKNFEICSKVRGNNGVHDVYIKVQNNEFEDIKCDCEEYKKNYAACKHIVATMVEFDNNPNYVKIFTGDRDHAGEIGQSTLENKTKQNEVKDYKIFKQLVSEFYEQDNTEQSNVQKKSKNKNIRIVPKLLIDKFNTNLKLEFQIGEEQLYRLKSIPEFYERMLNGDSARYGLKLEFNHTEDAFDEQSLPILKYMIKYGEIIKYANQSADEYGYTG